MEDYEYFHRLQKLSAYLDDEFAPHRELLAKIDAELTVEKEIIERPTGWTRDNAKLDAKRERLAELIEQAQKARAMYPDSRLEQNVQ